MSDTSGQFWRATAELAERKRALGLERLEKLRTEKEDAILERAVLRRLSQAENTATLSARSAILLDRLSAEKLWPARGIAAARQAR